MRLPLAAGPMLDGWGVLDQARIYQALGAIAGAPPGALGARGLRRSRHARSRDWPAACRGHAIDDLEMEPWFTGASDAERERLCRAWIAAFAGNANLALLAPLGAAMTPEEDMRAAGTGSLRQGGWEAMVAAIARLSARPCPDQRPASAVVQCDR